MTQRRTQSIFQQEDQHTMVTQTVNYMLMAASKQHVIKTSEITKNCLRGDKNLVDSVLSRAITTLENVYDMEIHPIRDEKLGRIYLCVSSAPAAVPFEFTVFERNDLRLLMLVLAYIFMKGGAVFEHVIFAFLGKLGLAEEPHEEFGHFKRLITESFVRQMYLKKSTINTEAEIEDRTQYSWGTRAETEFDKKDTLAFVADVLNKPVERFVQQYNEVQADHKMEAEEEE